jgi:hypothetical protein
MTPKVGRLAPEGQPSENHQAAAKPLDATSLTRLTRGMAKADFIKWLEGLLNGTRCRDCARPLYAARSVALGRGPRCAAKRAGRWPR